MRILITGGTGLIGQALIKELIQSDHQIVLHTRNKHQALHRFDTPPPRFESIVESLDDVDFNALDAVINLAGEPIVNKRWTAKQKQILCDSRWQLTESIVDKISSATSPPSVLISGSAIGIYGRQGDRHIDETIGDFYSEFSSTLCKKWEEIAYTAQSEKTRVCLLRTGIVLDQHGGALSKMLPAFRFGLGGPIADGQQAMSWVHIRDMVKIIIYLLTKPELHGAFNATAPNPVSNQVFSKALARQLKRPCIFRVPAFVLKLAMGEMSDLLVHGQYVHPKRLLDSGFQFSYPDIDQALSQLLAEQ